VGRPVDRRSDIFSFGAVLYEMFTGRRAFAGATTPDVLEAVVKNEPDWSALPAGTPVYLRKLLERMLAKDRKQRLQAIGEARIALASPEVEQGRATAPSRSRLSWILAATAALFAGVALWGWLKPAAPMAKPVTRFSMTLPSNGVFFNPALSRDGSLLAVPGGPGKPLYLRRMDQLEARALPGTEGAFGAAFSPDGQWIAYSIGGNPGSLKKIPVAGGAALTLVEGIALGGDLDWGLDDNIYFATTELLRVSSNGGKPQTLLTADPKKGELLYAFPQLLPGGKEVLVGRLTTKGFNLGQIVALNRRV
jgi:eukaryotic-like serine/threonine-protein kinase